MRRSLVGMALLGLATGCGREASGPVAPEYASPAVQVAPESRDIQAIIAEADARYGADDLAGAVPLYLQVAAQSAYARAKAAEALVYSDRVEDGYREALRAVEQDPASELTHEALGDAALAMHHLDEAEREFKLAINIAPAVATAHLGLSTVYFAQHRNDQRRIEEERGLELATNDYDKATALTQCGFGAIEDGDLQRAEQLFNLALPADPGWCGIYSGLAEVADRRHQLDRATCWERKALALNPKCEEEPLEVFEDQVDRVYSAARKADATEGLEHEAIAQWTELQKLECAGEVKHVDLHGLAALHLKRLGAPVPSCAALAQAARPSQQPAQPVVASANENNARPVRIATNAQDAARTTAPQLATAPVATARNVDACALSGMDNVPPGALRPSQAQLAEMDRVSAFTAQDEHEAAYKLARTIAADAPSAPEVLFLLGQAASDVGRLDESVLTLQHAVELAPCWSQPHWSLGASYYLKSDFFRARQEMETTLTLVRSTENKARTQENLAELDELAGDFRRAEEQLNQALELSSDQAGAYYALAFLYEVTDRAGPAQTMERYAIEMDQRGLYLEHLEFVWPELRLMYAGLAAEARHVPAEAIAAWTALQQLDDASALHLDWLRGRAAAHLATLSAEQPPVEATSPTGSPVVRSGQLLPTPPETGRKEETTNDVAFE